jgi:hypothetical protein
LSWICCLTWTSGWKWTWRRLGATACSWRNMQWLHQRDCQFSFSVSTDLKIWAMAVALMSFVRASSCDKVTAVRLSKDVADQIICGLRFWKACDLITDYSFRSDICSFRLR